MEWTMLPSPKAIVWLKGMAGTGNPQYLGLWQDRSRTVTTFMLISSLKEVKRNEGA
jgi:hypothetical protein